MTVIFLSKLSNCACFNNVLYVTLHVYLLMFNKHLTEGILSLTYFLFLIIIMFYALFQYIILLEESLL